MEVEQSHDFIRCLPPEMSDLIFIYLSSQPKWRYLIRRVCKQWFNYMNITQFKFGRIRGHQMSEIADSFSKYTTPIGFSFSYASIDDIRTCEYEPISKLSNLTSLTIPHDELTDGRDPTFISALTNLEQLTVHIISTNTLERLSKLKNLTAAVFILKDYYSDEDDPKTTISLPNLETANFNVVKIGDEVPILIDSYRLTRLNINDITIFPKDYFASLTNLRALNIYAQTVPVNNGHHSMIANLDAPTLPNLESLTTNSDVTFYENMVQSLTNLQLNCYGNRINPNNAQYIEQLTNLKNLSLRGIEEGHQHLDLHRLNQLTSLWLSRSDKPSVSIDFILNNLNAQSLQKLSTECLEYKQSLDFFTKFSNLTYLRISYHYTGPTTPMPIEDLTPIVTTLKNLTTFEVYGSCTPLLIKNLDKLTTFKNLSLLGKVVDK